MLILRKGMIYDIVCQYIIHFWDQIGIHLPKGLYVDASISLFHVHAHKDDCFFQFATTFIPEARVVAGEILESLWSSLNSISPSVRTATLAHWAKILDDHATDSNHKKMLGIVSTLCKSHHKAIDMLEHAEEYYNNLTKQAGPVATAKWKADIELAEACWSYNLPAMDTYSANLKLPIVQESAPLDQAGAALERWMAFALTVEDKQ